MFLCMTHMFNGWFAVKEQSLSVRKAPGMKEKG